MDRDGQTVDWRTYLRPQRIPEWKHDINLSLVTAERLADHIERLERENAMMREEFPCDGILDCVRCEHRVSPEECEVLEINAKHTIENAALREALLNALSAMRAWGAEEDGIPGDFGAWKAYCDGARLLGRDVDASDRAVEGADDE